jgi:diguanylate cyclase (GGDEF)-like protein
MRALLLKMAEFFGAHRAEQRDAHERDRARQRLIITLAMAAIAGWTALDASRHGPIPAATLLVLALLVGYALVAQAYRHFVLLRGGSGLLGQYGFIVLDAVVTVSALVGAPEIMAPFYSVLMVQIMRCGMRYGERTLWLAWGVAVVASAALMPFSAYWVGEAALLRSFIVMMLIIPVLFVPLVRTLHRATHDLRDAAGQDALTGLGNRRTLSAQLQRARQHCARDGGMLALMLFDLDNFKAVNDTLGHGVGDQLLVAVADALRAACRPGDLIARLGGDEFVVLVEGLPPLTGVALARDRADQLVAQIALAAQSVAPGLGVSASAGVHCWLAGPQDGGDAGHVVGESDLLTQADRAMYACKRAGKGRVMVTAPHAVGGPPQQARPMVDPARSAPLPAQTGKGPFSAR